MNQYKCRHFKIYELVDKDTYEKFGQKAWWFLDERILRFMDELRERLDKSITVNTWKWDVAKGKKIRFQWRGLRTAKYYKSKVSYSQHLFGRAFDFDVKGMTANEVRSYIRRTYTEYSISAIEKKVNWVHVDCRNVNALKEFNP